MIGYIIRRVVLVIPTLFVISIITFIIIQLPPGDYLTTYIANLQETGEEAEWVRSQAPGVLVIGKIEREESLRALPALAQRTDAVWVCRGDLGAQLGPARLAREVAAISPGACGAPLLMAGQVLQHLLDHDEPTRSEVCHLHDLLARGYAGIVLSDETAIGRDPIRAVRTASTLLQALTPPAPAAPR